MKLSHFVYSNSKHIFDAYECGYGYLNTPDKDEHIMQQEGKIWHPTENAESQYIGYGWYAKKLSDIERESTEIFNMQHFADTFDFKKNSMDNVYIVFSERRASVMRPMRPPPPTYIGWCIA
jgi:hypothetical protein